jgi:hypothetical protein
MNHLKESKVISTQKKLQHGTTHKKKSLAKGMN